MTSIKSIDAEVVATFFSRSEEWLFEVVEHLQEEEFVDESGTWWSSTRALSGSCLEICLTNEEFSNWALAFFSYLLQRTCEKDRALKNFLTKASCKTQFWILPNVVSMSITHTSSYFPYEKASIEHPTLSSSVSWRASRRLVVRSTLITLFIFPDFLIYFYVSITVIGASCCCVT